MTRMTHNDVLDSPLNYIKDNADCVWILSSTIVAGTYDTAKTNKLASATIASTIFTIGDGDVSGRKAAIAIISGVSVTTGGTAKNATTAASPISHDGVPASGLWTARAASLNIQRRAR